MNDRVYRSYDEIIARYIEHIRLAKQERDEARAEVKASAERVRRLEAALWAMIQGPADMLAYCHEHGLAVKSPVANPIGPTADWWRIQIATDALARPSTAGEKGDQHA